MSCKIQWVLGLLLLLPGLANAQARPAAANRIGNVGGRTSISLSGAWNAIVDPYETGLGARYYENLPDSATSVLRAARALPEYGRDGVSTTPARRAPALAKLQVGGAK
jgi:hypothetical protein